MGQVIYQDLKEIEPRKSLIDLDSLINKLSSIDSTVNKGQIGFQVEAILCLANEIKGIKEEMKSMKA